MATRTVVIRNNTEENKNWLRTFAPGESYTVPTDNSLVQKYSTLDVVLSAVASGEASIGNGTIFFSSISDQLNWLKDIEEIPCDSDGSPLQRVKVTTTGWSYQLHGIELETSKLDAIVDKKADNTDYGFTTVKFYKDVSGVDTLITGDDLNQTFLDSNCIKTTIDWEPTHDYELLGGFLKQASIPTENIYMWVVGVPDVPEAYGGSKPFVTSINLKFMGLEEGVKVDGRAPKYLTYSNTNHTNKLQLIFRHPVGIKHKIHMVFELFKA